MKKTQIILNVSIKEREINKSIFLTGCFSPRSKDALSKPKNLKFKI